MAVEIVKNGEGRIGYRVHAGGGMGRTPYIAHVMSEFVERQDILAYLEAVLRVYNQDSRRDNIHKQRIKILVNAIGPEEMRRARGRANSRKSSNRACCTLPGRGLARIQAYFAPPDFENLPDEAPELEAAKRPTDLRPTGADTISHAHSAPGYAIATISLKPIGEVPGDCRPRRWTRSPI